MDTNRIFLISDISGFTPEIGRLVSMMNYVRITTLDDVEGMTMEQLDYLHDPASNSIGALLMHMAAVEVEFQALTFEDRAFTAEELREWEPALALGAMGRSSIRGHELAYYVERLERARAATLEGLRQRDDAWLEVESPWWGGLPANNHFKWFHVFEDELNHRGQIRWLKKRAIAAAGNVR